MRLKPLFLLTLAATAAAQNPLATGSRVRTIPGIPNEPRRVGEIQSLLSDSAVVKLNALPKRRLLPETQRVALTRLEVPVTARHARMGALIGVGIGVLGGRLWGQTGDWGNVCGDTRDPSTCVKDRTMIPAFEVGGGLAGLLVGSLIGHYVKTESWKPLIARR